MKNLLFITDTKIPSRRASAIHVVKLFTAFGKIVDSVSLLSQFENASYEGVSVEESKHTSVKLPKIKGALFILLFKFKHKIGKLKPGFIYSRFIPVSLVVGSTPFILEFHDDVWNKGFLFRKAVNKALRLKNCLGFVVITEAIKDGFLEEFPHSKKPIRVIEDAASTPNENYEAVFRDVEKPTAAYVGSLNEGKGIELIIPLANQLPLYQFKVIGGEPDQIAHFKTQCKNENISFLGYVSHEEIWKVMEDVDVCLLPNQPKVKTGKKSNIGKYTSPLKMFEYMAYSKPIISSNLTVLKEVLDDQIAIFAIHNKVEEWVESLSILEDRKKREQLGRAAYQRFKQNYTWEKRAERILAFANEELERI